MTEIPNSLGNNVGRPQSSGAIQKIRTLHLMQCSLQFTDTLRAMEHDMKYAFSQGPDVIGFTEVVGPEMRGVFNRVCRENDYVPVIPTGKGLTVPLAVKLGGDPDTKIRSKGAKLALDGIAGQYENRYISWVQIKWHNQNIWVHEGHWSRMKNGEDKHRTVTTMMAGQVKKHGKGDAISFWMGDLNIDEGRDNEINARNMPNFLFREAGLLSLFDELHTLPPRTHAAGVYDVIGCYRPDKQVEGKRFKVHPKQRSDHSPVSGWYDIDVAKRASNNVGSIGTIVDEAGGLTDPSTERVDPDFYATGGNIDWSDYLNDDLYPLPYAYGDSDSHRHG